MVIVFVFFFFLTRFPATAVRSNWICKKNPTGFVKLEGNVHFIHRDSLSYLGLFWDKNMGSYYYLVSNEVL